MDILFLIFIIILFFAFFGLFYFNAEKLYWIQKNMKDNNPDLFKIVGSNEKYLNDKDKWIKHYRIYIC